MAASTATSKAKRAKTKKSNTARKPKLSFPPLDASELSTIQLVMLGQQIVADNQRLSHQELLAYQSDLFEGSVLSSSTLSALLNRAAQ